MSSGKPGWTQGGGLQTKQHPGERGCTGTACWGVTARPACKHRCILGELQSWARGGSLPSLCRGPLSANGTVSTSPPVHRGRGKKRNEHPTGCQLLLRAPKAPKQPPCSVHRLHSPLTPSNTVSPYQSPLHPTKPPAKKPHAQQSPATWRSCPKGHLVPITVPPQAVSPHRAPQEAPSAGAACCAPCPRDGRPCWGDASPPTPPRHAPTARPRDRGCRPAAPAPPSSQRRTLRLQGGETRVRGGGWGWVRTAPASHLLRAGGQRWPGGQGPARGARLGWRGGEQAGLIFRV